MNKYLQYKFHVRNAVLGNITEKYELREKLSEQNVTASVFVLKQYRHGWPSVLLLAKYSRSMHPVCTFRKLSTAAYMHRE